MGLAKKALIVVRTYPVPAKKGVEVSCTAAESPKWSDEQLAILSQGDLFDEGPVSDLEKIPFDFRYKFRCREEPSCPGHRMICTDWEMLQSWREWRDIYGANLETKFRQRYETEMINRFDTHFYVGTLHAYPSKWIIVGLFYPPKSKLSLFPDD